MPQAGKSGLLKLKRDLHSRSLPHYATQPGGAGTKKVSGGRRSRAAAGPGVPDVWFVRTGTRRRFRPARFAAMREHGPPENLARFAKDFRKKGLMRMALG